MAGSLSNLVNSLSKGIFKFNVTMDMIIKNVKFAELNINIVTVFLNIQTLKNTNVYIVTKIINKNLMKS